MGRKNQEKKGAKKYDPVKTSQVILRAKIEKLQPAQASGGLWLQAEEMELGLLNDESVGLLLEHFAFSLMVA